MPKTPILFSRRLLYGLIACIGFPILFFVGLELILTVAGFGYPTHFFLNKTVLDKPVLITNWQYGWRFFPPKIARKPEAMVVSPHKEDEVYRIVVLGGSAAQGDPNPEYGFSRMLEVMLEAHYPEKKFEVINTAMTGINSFTVREIAKDCNRLQPDLYIIYMGNNEVVGPFGAGTVLKTLAPPLWMIRANLGFQKTCVGQGMTAFLDKFSSNRPETWMGMKMFNNLVRWESKPLQKIYDHFQANLNDILRITTLGKAKTILCTVGVNLKDCAPFGSIHKEGMTPDDKLEWNALLEEAIALEAQEKLPEALDTYLAAEELDDQDANIEYHIARILYKNKMYEVAAKRFAQARDLDALRFRADSTINQIIRAAAKQHESSDCRLADFETRLNSASENGIPGDTYFYEHVHLNPEGNYLLAQQLLEKISMLLSGIEKLSPSGSLSLSEVKDRLAYTEWNAYQICQTLSDRINEAPFIYQINNTEHQKKLLETMRHLAETPQPKAIAEALQTYKQALQKRPDDYQIRYNYAGLLVTAKQFDQAENEYHWLMRHNPFDPAVPVRLGDAYTKQKKTDDAIRMYDLALELRPEYNRAMYYKGIALANGGRIDKAIQLFKKFLALYPDHGHGHVNLAMLYNSRNQPEKAMHQLEIAIKLNRRDKLAQNQYGVALAKKGQLEEALKHFKEALRVDPRYAAARKNFNMAIQKMNAQSQEPQQSNNGPNGE